MVLENDYLNIQPEHEILTQRIFGFSRNVVFNAWENSDSLSKWWGPAGFTNTFHEFNFVPGGTWKFTMHGPDKGHYENECRFIEIKAPSMIVWQRISKPIFRVVTTFEAIGTDETKLAFRMQFESTGECDKIRKFAAEKNEENFDRLYALLKTL